jgi:hypothetical protein
MRVSKEMTPAITAAMISPTASATAESSVATAGKMMPWRSKNDQEGSGRSLSSEAGSSLRQVVHSTVFR